MIGPDLRMGVGDEVLCLGSFGIERRERFKWDGGEFRSHGLSIPYLAKGHATWAKLGSGQVRRAWVRMGLVEVGPKALGGVSGPVGLMGLELRFSFGG